MKFLASIRVDLERGPLGTPSRLAEPLAGKPALRRTVERALAAKGLAGVHLIARSDQAPAVEKLVEGLNVQVERAELPASSFEELIRTGRWWGLDGWRSGIGSLCAFDEDFHAAGISALANREEADAVVSIPAAAPLIHPALIDAMTRHYERAGHEFQLTFAQAPPGLAPFIIGRALATELGRAGEPPGLILAYRPDQPIADLTVRDACYKAPAEVIEAGGRLIADTRRSRQRAEACLEAGGEAWTPEEIGRWLARRCATHVEPVPEEIEIELTTRCAADGPSRVRPGGNEVPSRGPIDRAVVRRIAEWIADYDDVRIVLGGFGDPLCHPQFAEIVGLLRPHAAAIAVRTPARVEAPAAVDTPAAVEASAAVESMFTVPVDVIEVTLDAATRDTYRRVHGVDAFESVSARLESWLARREKQGRARPLIVPSFVKCRENLAEMEAFFDGWQQRLGMVLVTGATHYAGQRASDAVTSMAPPQRGPCRRVRSRCLILADGQMTTCDQDFAGRQAVGSVAETPLGHLWLAPRFRSIRTNEIAGQPLCPHCEEWHRP